MSEPDCKHSVDAAPYVLGALDDSSDFAAHLAGCEQCQAEVARLGEGAEVLPRAVTPVAAPRELIDSVMSTVRAEAEVLSAAGAEADRPAGAGRRWFDVRALALGTALAAVIVAIALVAIPGGPDSDQVVPGEVIAKSMPATASVRLYEGDGRAHLKVTGMPKAGEGRIYEVWLQRPDDAMTATDALFDVTADGHGSVHVPDLAGAKAIYVTNEPEGGSRQPTSAPLLRVQLKS